MCGKFSAININIKRGDKVNSLCLQFKEQENQSKNKSYSKLAKGRKIIVMGWIRNVTPTGSYVEGLATG